MNSIKNTQKKPRFRPRIDRAWFNHLSRHPAKKWSVSHLSTRNHKGTECWSPHGARNIQSLAFSVTVIDNQNVAITSGISSLSLGLSTISLLSRLSNSHEAASTMITPATGKYHDYTCNT